VKTKDHINLILFDLGGVLIDFTGAKKILEWTREKMTEPELITWYFNSPAVREFETGKIGTENFAGLVLSELSLPVEKKEFLEELDTWFLGPYPGTKDLLTRLALSYRLATLSNTNELFWEKFKTTDIFDIFQLHFPSYKMGMLKPDPRIFLHVLDSTGLSAEQILFFDDSLPNVEAALKIGIQSYKVIGFQDLESQLVKLNFL